MKNDRFGIWNMDTMTVAFQGTNEHVIKMQCKAVVCFACNGRGKSSAYLGAFTSDEWDEMGQDWQEDYISGTYDRRCEECEGERITLEVDRDSYANQRDNRLEKWDEHCRNIYGWIAEEMAERRAGA